MRVLCVCVMYCTNGHTCMYVTFPAMLLGTCSVYPCMDTHVHGYTHTHMHTHTHIVTHTHTHAHAHTHTVTHTHTAHTQHTHTHTHTHMHTHTVTHTHSTHTHAHVFHWVHMNNQSEEVNHFLKQASSSNYPF